MEPSADVPVVALHHRKMNQQHKNNSSLPGRREKDNTMFVYTIRNMFGQTIVSKINRLPNGSVSIVSTTDISKALHYEEVERLLTVSERRNYNLELGWLED